MRNSRLRRILCGTGTLAFLAGCSSGGAGNLDQALLQSEGRLTTQASGTLAISSVPNFARNRLLQPTAGGGASPAHIGHTGSCPTAPVGFISEFNSGEIEEFNSAGTLCATLTGFSGPSGLATDASGNLYVANQTAADIVEIAPPYTGAPIETYMDPGELPLDVAVDESGNLAVTNFDTTNNTAGDIAFYNAGSTSGPAYTVSGSTYTSPRFCAFNKHGNLFFDDVDFFNTQANNLGAVLKGSMSITPLTISNTIEFPGGVEINNSGQLAVLDQGAFDHGGPIYTYNVSSPDLGPPVEATGLLQSNDPIGFAFSPGSRLVLVADASLQGGELYHYPSGGNPIRTVGGTEAVGAAIVPSEQFSIRSR